MSSYEKRPLNHELQTQDVGMVQKGRTMECVVHRCNVLADLRSSCFTDSFYHSCKCFVVVLQNPDLLLMLIPRLDLCTLAGNFILLRQ